MRVPTRLVLPVATLTLAAGAATLALPAGASPGGGGCSMSGTAKFSHGPNTSAHAFTYTFTGGLYSCQSSNGTPATGTIATLVPSKGTGTCASNTGGGTALVTWADRTTTIVGYTTQSLGAEVVLQGKVIPSYKVGKKTYRTTRDKGYAAFGDLGFDASPQQCAGSGVTTASIIGVTGLGTQS
jgi:hypothetical protein